MPRVPRAYNFMLCGGGGPGPGLTPDWMGAGWLENVQSTMETQQRWLGAGSGMFIQLPFGHWQDAGWPMKINAYDDALALGPAYLTDNFAEAWEPYSGLYRIYAHIGNIHWQPDLLALPYYEQIAMVERNVQPLKDAGISVSLDTASDAILEEYTIAASSEVISPSEQANVLRWIDSMRLRHRTAIEPMPRSFAPWAPLWDRDVFINEVYFENICAHDGQIGAGFGTGYHSWVRGRVHRILWPDHFGWDHAAMITRINQIQAAGDVPVFPVWWFQLAGYTVEQVLGYSVDYYES